MHAPPQTHEEATYQWQAAGRKGGGEKVQLLRRELGRLHHQAKSNLKDGVHVGGGVSMWPAMDDMRLSREDVWRLVAVCVLLIACTIAFFRLYHGSLISKLENYAEELEAFPHSHSLPQAPDQVLFREKLLSWHRDFLQLQTSIHQDFDVIWSETTITSNSILVLYILCIVTLLYFLVDNMLSKSRLTPARIKVWISLLCVVTGWTLLTVHLLMAAQRVETASRAAVYALNEELAVLVGAPLDLTLYHNVLLYWRTRCLPPTSPGVLSVLGLAQVQDITLYLQYYSLPVATAICTPIVKLLMSLRTVYCI